MTKILRKKYLHSAITVVEHDPLMLKIFISLITEEEVERITVVEGSIDQIGLEPAIFDIVIIRAVLQHLADPSIAIAEVYRLLKEQGKIIVLMGTPALNPSMILNWRRLRRS